MSAPAKEETQTRVAQLLVAETKQKPVMRIGDLMLDIKFPSACASASEDSK